jgi:MFS family permease
VVNTALGKVEEQTRVAWLSALIGAWGVLNGFAIFILWTQPAPGQTIWSFVLGLAAAAVASWLIETLRERLRPPEHSEDTKGPEGSRITRFALTLVSLATFELFIVGSERSLDVFSNPTDVGTLRTHLLGPSSLSLGGDTRDLITLAVMWILAGAALCGALAGVVMLPRSESIAKRSRDGLYTGFIAALAAPMLVLIYVLGTRVVLALGLAFFHPAEWQQHADALAPRDLVDQSPGVAGGAWWYLVFQIIGPLFTAGLIGKLEAIAAVLVLFALGKFLDVWWPFLLFLVAIVIAVVAPLSFDLSDLLQFPLLAFVVWLVPGAILGAAAPLLENPSQRARLWASVSVLMGAIVVAVTLLSAYHDKGFLNQDRDFLAAGIVLVGVGVVLLRRDDLQIGWPFLAIAVSLATSAATAVVLHNTASFHKVLTDVAKINSLPASVAGNPNNLMSDLRFYPKDLTGSLSGLRYRDPPQREKLLDSATTAVRTQRNTMLIYTGKSEYQAIAAEPILYARCRSVHSMFMDPPEDRCFGASERSLVSMTLVGFVNPPLEKASDTQLLARIRQDQRAINAARVGPTIGNYAYGHYSVWSEVSADEDTFYRTTQQYAKIDADIAAEYAITEKDKKSIDASEQTEAAWESQGFPEKLELAMAGSVAFWMTVALLAAWQSRRNAEAAADEEDAAKPVTDAEPEAHDS